MNNTQHTPGPWGILEEIGHPSLITAWNENAGATDDIAVVCDEYEGQPSQANARLIAAAPDLLAALQGMLEWARRVEVANPGHEIVDALEAIDKATK